MLQALWLASFRTSTFVYNFLPMPPKRKRRLQDDVNVWPVYDSRNNKHYGGSRRWKQRYRYSEATKAGFVELHPDYKPKELQLLAQLKKAEGVDRALLHSSKTSQNNAGNHWCERNVLFFFFTISEETRH